MALAIRHDYLPAQPIHIRRGPRCEVKFRAPYSMTHALIAIPTLNEAGTIAHVLADLLADDHRFPIVVFDGGSTDCTCDIVNDFARQHPQVRLLHNLERTQARAINAAARIAQQQGAQVLVRVDAHARYPKGFVSALVRTIQERGADSIVTPLIAIDHSEPWPHAAAVLQRSWLGNGGAAHRRTTSPGWVDHGHHAAFRLSAFLVLGGYNTDFCANEDAEYDHRLTQAGGRIYLDTNLPVLYLPRASPAALFAQMRRNGFWRMHMLRHHNLRPALRQLLPLFATALCPFSAIAGIVWAPFAIPVMIYLIVVAVTAATVARKTPALVPRVMLLAIFMHLGFGLGGFAAMRVERRPYQSRQLIA